MDPEAYIEKSAEQIDKIIDRYFGGGGTELARASAHLLLAGGKRLRPTVALLSAEAVQKGGSDAAIPAAIALELTHNFTLIHDDIMDGDSLRRGVPTVHAKWDEPTAILAGDVLFARSFEFITLSGAPDNAKVRAVSMLSRTCAELCEGQHMDMSFEDRDDVDEFEYLEMVRKKTGVLYAASAGIGAIMAQGPAIYADALYHYGLAIGTAFQIQDDLIDLLAPAEKSGKDRASDLREGKKTLISIKARNKGIDLKPYRRDLSDSEIDGVVTLLERSGVIREVREVADDLVRSARENLAILPESEEKQLLLAIGEFFVSRGM
jgi:geranylgeranyl diphosphate synthase, type I